jgi:SAM-dependent methyltransferase
MKKFISNIINSNFPTYINVLKKASMDCESLLDVGCGYSSPVQYLNKNINSVGLDAFEPNIVKSKNKGIHKDYVIGNFDSLEKLFKRNSFDCVLANDVIEHLSKEDGLIFLENLLRIAKKKVIIFTPNGFLPQGPIGGNIWMTHKSGWEVEEMKDLGFKVYGINGLKPLRGERCKIKYKPLFFWTIISFLTQLFTYRRPQYASQIFCVKEV